MPTLAADNNDIAFDLAPVALCVTRQRLITRCNQAFEDLFGYPRAELLLRSIAVLYPSANEFERVGQRGYPRMRMNGSYQDERLMRHRDGSLVWCRAHGRAADPQHAADLAVWSFQATHAAPDMALTFSPREREIVAMLVRGLSTKAMAQQLGLSPRTVEMHRARLLRKAQVHSTAQLLALCT